MHVCIVNNSKIPALMYGGTERVIWWLGKELVRLGHRVTYIVAEGSHCPFANVVAYDSTRPINELIPSDVDVVHLHHAANETPVKPYLVTMHGNLNEQYLLDINTVFVSRNHAARFGSDCFVHNGIDPEDYGKPTLTGKRNSIHFLGDAAWRVKNVRGAISIARKARVPIEVIGGRRFNFNMGIRLTFDPNARFHGMKGGQEKNDTLDRSKALLFPVLWHEPFGLAIIESLYFGCPVIATPYGSLPELVPWTVGFLSANSNELVNAVKNVGIFDPQVCHDHVLRHFTSAIMTQKYLGFYEQVANGAPLNAVAPQLKQVQQEKFLPFS
ncbi:MAG: glycosyltransferase [Bacteroidota bacterium]